MDTYRPLNNFLKFGDESSRLAQVFRYSQLNLKSLFLGENSFIQKIPSIQFEYVIVFENPDETKPDSKIFYEDAKNIFSKGFSSLPQSYQLAFESVLDHLPETNEKKALTGGGKIIKDNSNFSDSGKQCADFLTLVRNTVQTVLEVELNIKTSLFLSDDGKRIYLCLSTSPEALLEEAERTEFNLQLELLEVDSISLEPCDQKLRPLRFLTHGHQKISDKLKALEGFKYFKDRPEKKYEPCGVTRTQWQAYFEYLELLQEGLKENRDFKRLSLESQERVNFKFGFKALKNLWNYFNIEKPFGPFMDYSSTVPKELWRTYKVDHNMNVSLLRNIDKLKLIPSYISRFVKLDHLKHKKMLLDFFPLHNYWELDGSHSFLYKSLFQNYCQGKNYARVSLIQKWKIPVYRTTQPVHAIRKYFGEKIGLYFAFLGLNGKLLALPSFIGVGVFVVQRLYKPGFFVTIVLNAFYSVYMTVVSVIMIEVWKRKQSALATQWGQTDFEEDEVERPEFTGTERRSPITDDMEEVYYSKSKTKTFIFIGILVTVLILLLVLSALTGILIFRKMITNDLIILNYDFAGVVCSVLNAVQIQVFNFIFKIVISKVNKIENHRTLSEYESSLIVKTYLFQFVNSFSSLYYIAFIKTHFEGCLVTTGNKKKLEIGADCMEELYTQLLSLFVILFLKNIIEVLQPYLKFKFRTQFSTSGDQNVQGLTYELDKQFFLDSYDAVDSEGSLQDYMELVIMLGYTTLFAVAFPLSSFLTYLAILIEIQVDKFKLLYLLRRPNPIGGKSIGVWQSIFTFNCTAAILTNIGIICFTIPAMSQFELTKNNLYFTYTLAVLVLLGLQWLIQLLIPDIPKSFMNIFKRHKHITEKRLFQKKAESSEDKDSNLPNFCVHVPNRADFDQTFYNS